jgi:DNA polymerase-3 subunit gamma/tau
MFTDTYRPKSHRQLIGEVQRDTANYLLNSVKEDKHPKAILLTGASGLGKTTVAKIYAEALLCNNLASTNAGLSACGECEGCLASAIPIIEINCARETGIENIREITQNMRLMPFGGKYKVYILDEVHALSKAAQNGLLTPLENLPPHVVFIMATTEVGNLLPTLRSRCMEFEFKVPSVKEQTALVSAILRKEGLEKEPEQLEELVHSASGNLRALVHITQQYANGTYKPGAENIEETDLVTAIFKNRCRNVSEMIKAVSSIDDYNRTLISLLSYSMTVIRNPRDKELQKICAKFILLFGNGLTGNLPPRYLFSTKLVELYYAING